jgi:GAF domain-containing protein
VSDDDRSLTRAALTALTFVEIVDTLVDDFDVIDVLTVLASRCVQLLEASAAGILLADTKGKLRVMAASNEQMALLELFQIQNDQGPCLDCYTTGQVVYDDDLRKTDRWPVFGPESVRLGLLAVCAVPLRIKDLTLGCLNLFMGTPVRLSDPDVALARALAHVASIAIAQDQGTRRATLREGQLQHALTSRIAIEQAKGMIAERGKVDMDTAFARLRAYARIRNRKLTDVAIALVNGSLPVDAFLRERAGPATRTRSQ